MDDDGLLVWRDDLNTPSDAPGFEEEAELYGLSRTSGRLGEDGQPSNYQYWTLPVGCPFCGTKLESGNQTIFNEPQIGSDQYESICSFCHYHNFFVNELWFNAHDMRMELGSRNIKRQWLHRPVLKSFDLNDSSVAFQELGSWIASHPEQVGRLTPRKFEELVADVFRSLKGFEVRLTQASKDGGIDAYLLEKDGTQAIVQVKRYRSDRKLGVELIDQVRGLKLRPENHEVTKAYIVTSSSFTNGAVKLAANPPTITKFDLELIDCERLLRELSCYGGGVASLPEAVRDRLRRD